MTIAILLLVGFLGLVGHWFKRWYRKQCKKNFIQYMVDDWGYSLSSVITMCSVVLYTVEPGTDLTQASLALAYSVGYMVDSHMNKDTDSEIR